jgi:hypothetical protein
MDRGGIASELRYFLGGIFFVFHGVFLHEIGAGGHSTWENVIWAVLAIPAFIFWLSLFFSRNSYNNNSGIGLVGTVIECLADWRDWAAKVTFIILVFLWIAGAFILAYIVKDAFGLTAIWVFFVLSFVVNSVLVYKKIGCISRQE